MFAKPVVLVLAAIVGLLAQSNAAPAQTPTIPDTHGMPLPSPSWMREHDMPGWQDRGGARLPQYEATMPGPRPAHHAATEMPKFDTRATDEDFQRGVDLLGSALGRLARRHAQQRAASQYYGQQASCPPGYAPQWYGADLTGKPILVCR
jgi:hypothetical protein